jgi:hypothetical protein
MPRDFALTEDEDEPGTVLVHRADCPDARRLAALGRPVMTLLDCTKPLPADIKRHSCLERIF